MTTSRLTFVKEGFFLSGDLEGGKPRDAIPVPGGLILRSPVVAANYISVADERTKRALRAAMRKNARSRSLSGKSTLRSHPRGLSYLPYQVAGIETMLEEARCLNADEPGTGKTVQTAGLINETDVEKVLILCPASLILNWKRELEKWVFRELKELRIESYDSAWREGYFHQLASSGFDLIVMDEAHYLKDMESKRSMAASALAKNVKRVVLLTGTPVMNRPRDLFPLLNILHPEVFPDFDDFAFRYCNAFVQTITIRMRNGKEKVKKVWNRDGSSHEQELQDILRSSFMIRRLKADVLPQLPKKVRQIIEIPVKTEASEEEISIWEKACGDIGYEAAVKQLTEGSGVVFDKIAKVRQQVALDKVPFVVEHVENMLLGGKVVVFAHHKSVVDELMKGFAAYKPVKFVGGMSNKAKDAAVEAFQNDPECRVFVGNLIAAGVGITLTASSTVVFAELGLVPSVMGQAEDRCCRIGASADSIAVQHIVLNGSLDVRLAKMLLKKQKISDLVLDL